jgi:lipoprotein NlpI
VEIVTSLLIPRNKKKHVLQGQLLKQQIGIYPLSARKGGSGMQRIVLMVILLLSLVVCLTSLGGAGGLDDIKAGFETDVVGDYDKAIEINPNDAFVYNNRGDILYHQAMFREAIADYKKAIESNYRPNDYPYLNLLRTVSKVSQEDYQVYLQKFREYVTSQKAEDWIRIVSRYYLGMDQLTEGDVLAEARKGKDQREKKERLCEAYYYLGEKRLAQGDRKGAEKFFRKSIKTKIHYFPQYLSSKAVLKVMGGGGDCARHP